MTKAVFLDRDGVVNQDYGYVHKKEDFEFIPGVFDYLRHAGFPAVIITNQSGLGRGYFTQNDLDVLNTFIEQRFAKEGVKLLGIYYCPHRPNEGCSCRKPSPQMIRQAAKDHGIDLENSVMIGDKQSDIDAAKAAGVGKKIAFRSRLDGADIIAYDFKDLTE